MDINYKLLKKMMTSDPRIPSNKILISLKDFKKRTRVLSKWGLKGKILDCGSGGGYFGFLFNMVGFERDRVAAKLSKRIETVCLMDCYDLGFKKNVFDTILALNLMEHLKTPKKFLNEIKRVSSKDASIIISIPEESFIRKLLKKESEGSEGTDYKGHQKHWQNWNKKSFKKFLLKNGIKVLDVKHIGRFPFLPQTNMYLCKFSKTTNNNL